MPDKIIHKSGAIEHIATPKEKAIKAKHKDKKAADLSTADLKELVYELAKQANLI